MNSKAFVTIVATVSALALLSACADRPQGREWNESTVTLSARPWPSPRIEAPGAPPRIIALWMNETTIPSGTDWIGRAITSTNVASLEVRTESFSFVAARTTFGDFRFDQHVLDIVPQYKRAYILQIIARNSAGAQDSVLVPIRFR